MKKKEDAGSPARHPAQPRARARRRLFHTGLLSRRSMAPARCLMHPACEAMSPIAAVGDGLRSRGAIAAMMKMKSAIRSAAGLLALLTLAGCASFGQVRDASPITAQKPFDLDLIWVKTSSALPATEAETRMLGDAIVSALRDTQLFKQVSGNKAELGSGSGITIEAEITRIRKISKNTRLWAGALAGRARIQLHVRIADFNSGKTMETFDADAESSGGSALAGTTDEAIEQAAGEVVGEVLKINSQTAE